MSRFQGVGVPTGQEHTRSNPGTGKTIGSGAVQVPKGIPQFRDKQVSVIELDLETATTEKIDFSGTLVYYGAAVDSANAVLTDRIVYIRFDRSTNARIPLLPGVKYSGVPFDRIFVDIPGNGDAGDVGFLSLLKDNPSDRVDVE